jgi:hypothetical protein
MPNKSKNPDNCCKKTKKNKLDSFEQDEPPLTWENLEEFMCPCKQDKGEKLYDLLTSWLKKQAITIDPNVEFNNQPDNIKLAFVMASNNKFGDD